MNWLKHNWLLMFLAILIGIAIFWSFELFRVVEDAFGSFFPQSSNREEWGVLGDLFGGLLNPFFTFLGLIMLLVTLYQNQKELSLSRKEFKESADALRIQARTLEKQRFEDTFFSLLGQHNIALNSVTKERSRAGPDGMNHEVESICHLSKVRYVGDGIYYPIGSDYPGLRESKELLLKDSDKLNQYFRILYQILKFIAANCPGSTISGEITVNSLESTKCSHEEKLYSNIVRSLLPRDAYYLLAINCVSYEKGDPFYKYRLLVERYSFLEHMPLTTEDLMNAKIIQEIMEHYDQRAFGDNPQYVSNQN